MWVELYVYTIRIATECRQGYMFVEVVSVRRDSCVSLSEIFKFGRDSCM